MIRERYLLNSSYELRVFFLACEKVRQIETNSIDRSLYGLPMSFTNLINEDLSKGSVSRRGGEVQSILYGGCFHGRVRHSPGLNTALKGRISRNDVTWEVKCLYSMNVQGQVGLHTSRNLASQYISTRSARPNLDELSILSRPPVSTVIREGCKGRAGS